MICCSFRRCIISRPPVRIRGKVAVSVLDAVPLGPGRSPAQAIAETMRVGIRTEAAYRLDPRCAPVEREQVSRMYVTSGYLIGNSQTVAGDLADLAERTGADEIMLASAEFEVDDWIRPSNRSHGAWAGPVR